MYKIHSSIKYIGISLNMYGRGSEQQVTTKCRGANTKNMPQRIIRYTFTGVTKLSKALKPITIRNTILYSINAYLVLCSSKWVTAKPEI